MAATTISRATLTDGVSVWNAALVGTSIYDKIDAVLAGHVLIGGTLGAEGFGTHSFTAGGTGANTLQVKNTTAGTGNYARVMIYGDTTYLACQAYASTYTTSTYNVQAGAAIVSNGAGGLSIVCTDAGGTMRFFTGGTTERAQFDAQGNLQLTRGLWFTGSYDQGITGTQALDSAGQYYPVIRLTAATSTPKISSCTAGNDGDIKIIVNVSGAACTVQHNGGGPTTRIYLANATDGTIGDDESLMILYDAGSSSWIEVGPR
jgi:hypothetical protein